MHELHDDIEHYLSLEKHEANIEFWTVSDDNFPCYHCSCSLQHMMVICKDRLDRITSDQRLGREAAAAVEADITALLQGKSYDHLLVLQRQIQAKLSSGGPVDVDYWEGLLKKLLVWKSKVRHTLTPRRIYLPPHIPSGTAEIPARSCCSKPS